MPVWKSMVSSCCRIGPRRFPNPLLGADDQAAQRAQRGVGAGQMGGCWAQGSTGTLRGAADKAAGPIDRGGGDAGPSPRSTTGARPASWSGRGSLS